MAKMFVHYQGTLDSFKQLSNLSDYSQSIVFIKGGADGKGAAIYAQGNYYASINEALAGLKYLSSVKAGGVTATASGPNGVIEFSAADPATVSVSANSTGVSIGLTDDFKKSVSDNTAAIAANAKAITDEASARVAAINSTKNELNSEIAKKATVEALNGAVGRIAAIEGDYLKAADIEGKVNVADYNVQVAALVKADSDNLAAAKEYAEGQAAAALASAKTYAEGEADAAETAAKSHAETKANEALSAAKTYADGLASNYDESGAAANALQSAKSYADGLKSTIETNYAAADDATLSAAKQYAKEYADDIVSGDNGLSKEVAALELVVNKLVGSDANMSAREIAIDEITKQLTAEGISESFDTLKEIAEWLSAHPQDVTKMNEAIKANEDAIDVESGRIDNIVADYLKGADKTELSGAITEEVNRAKGVEEGLQGQITTLSGLVGSEKVSDVEARLQANIDKKVALTDYNAKMTELANADAQMLADAKSHVAAEIAKLDVDDVAVSGKYVSSVSEVDGKISVTRADLPVYTLVEGTANGTVKFNGTDVNVHGLGSAAYTNSNIYATAAQGAKADAAAPADTVYTKAEVEAMWAWEVI